MSLSKNTLCITFLAALVACTAGEKNPKALTKEQLDELRNYPNVREAFKQNMHALAETPEKADVKRKADLTKRLRVILKNSLFKGDGDPSLPELLSGIGMDQLDGLSVQKDSLRIFYTHEQLCFEIFGENQFTRFEQLKPDDFALLFERAFIDDATVTSIQTLQVPAEKGIQAYATIGTATQGYYLSLPEYLFVLAVDDGYVYMTILQSGIKSIEKCDEIIKAVNRDSTKVNADVADWANYCNCYRTELKKKGEYERLKKEAEKVVARIIGT